MPDGRAVLARDECPEAGIDVHQGIHDAPLVEQHQHGQDDGRTDQECQQGQVVEDLPALGQFGGVVGQPLLQLAPGLGDRFHDGVLRGTVLGAIHDADGLAQLARVDRGNGLLVQPGKPLGLVPGTRQQRQLVIGEPHPAQAVHRQLLLALGLQGLQKAVVMAPIRGGGKGAHRVGHAITGGDQPVGVGEHRQAGFVGPARDDPGLPCHQQADECNQ